jgi:hypothetical protein
MLLAVLFYVVIKYELGDQRPNLVKLIPVNLKLHIEVVSGLQVNPEALGRSQRPGQAQRRVGTDRPFAVDDFIDPPWWNANSLRKPVLANAQRAKELLEQDLSRMNRLMHAVHDQFPSVIVGDLNVGGSRRGPYEADSPLIIDADAVLPGPIAFESLKPIPWRHT